MALRELGKIIRLSRQRAREGGLPFGRQLSEMLALEIGSGIGPSFYHEARLWRGDVPFEQKKGYILGARYRKLVASINAPSYYKLSQNKIAEKAILQAFGIRTPRMLGVFDRLTGRDVSGRPLRSADDLLRLFDELRGERVCLKLIEGSGGKGFVALEILSAQPLRVRHLLEADEIDARDFVERRLASPSGRQFVIEAYLEQHPVMKALNPTSVNTVRFWTLRDDAGVRTVGALVRIGNAGKLTDNTSSGGLCADVDLESGVLGAARFLDGEHQLHVRHPAHGAAISGVQVPYWSEARTLACDALDTIPRLRFAGLDIAFAPDGPVVLELNPEPDPIHQACMGNSAMHLLGGR